jgi:hypothetical protein
MEDKMFKKIAFSVFIFSLIYVPTQWCNKRGICTARDYDFIFDISRYSSLDFGRYVIQIIVVLVIIYGLNYFLNERR